MDLTNKKVLVVGLGRSGFAACKLLLSKGAKVSVTDNNNQFVRDNADKLKSEKNIINMETGFHTGKLVQSQDLVVVSPGVNINSEVVSMAKRENIPVIGEIELAYLFCPAPIIAITGTNGKTTVTTLVGEIFHNAGYKCVVCGNIGVPFSGEVNCVSPEHIVVLEVSSFQLETIDKFKPKVAVVLNLDIDHLDRHCSFNEYFRVKSRIFLNQDEDDWAVLNQDDSYSSRFAESTKARIKYFSQGTTKKGFNANHSAALTIASLFNISPDTAENTCYGFEGVEHRIEKVTMVKDVEFINDSKATNVNSTLWALNSMEKQVVLIAGGRDKGADFRLVSAKVKEQVKSVVLLGEAAGKIEQSLSGVVPIKKATNLAEAVKIAFSLAGEGGCVLLSPMCASFDMFRDYNERGKAFKQAVYNLAAEY